MTPHIERARQLVLCVSALLPRTACGVDMGDETRNDAKQGARNEDDCVEEITILETIGKRELPSHQHGEPHNHHFLRLCFAHRRQEIWIC